MFKYSERKFIQALLSMGSVRVGTLYDFRRTEHAQGVSDPQEGKKIVKHELGEHFHVSGSEDPNFKTLSNFLNIDRMRDVNFYNCAVSKEFDHPNLFIFCTSKVRSRTTMREFEKAEACVEIIDTQGFYDELTITLNSIIPVTFRGVFEVLYQSRQEEWNEKDWGQSPALIKDLKNPAFPIIHTRSFTGN